jgi:hypothetical protein
MEGLVYAIADVIGLLGVVASGVRLSQKRSHVIII